MVPVGGFVWGYANSYTTTLYLIFDFKRLLSKLKTEAFNIARNETILADIAAAELAAKNDPPSFVGRVFREFDAYVNEEAEAGSTIEILSAYAMDPDEVSVEMIFSGTNSIRNFASVEVVTTTDF